MVGYSRERNDLIEEMLRSMFRVVLRNADADVPQLREVRCRRDERRDEIEIRAYFTREGREDYVQRSYLRGYDMMRMGCGSLPPVGEFIYNAGNLWHAEYERHYMDRVVDAASRHAYEVMAVTSPMSAEGMNAMEVVNRLREHVHRFHEIPAETLAGGSSSTATEVRARQELALRALGRSPWAGNPWTRNWTDAFWRQREEVGSAGYGFASIDIDVGTEEAQRKGITLLRENLTPEQREQYDRARHFDIKGGVSGKTYRIHHGRQMNIHELDAAGNKARGWCFLPQGGLVAGDVMLAQKTALELYETEALAIANPF